MNDRAGGKPAPALRAGGRQPTRPRGYSAAMIERQTTLRVRPVRPEEYESLGELTVAAYHSLPDVMDHQAEYDLQLRDVARRAAVSCVLVAIGRGGEGQDDDEALLGGVTYVRGPEDPYSEELAEGEAGMRMLAVDPALQRRGVGRALTLACLERARAEGRRRLVLHTGAWMPAAIRLYQSMGFARRPDLDFAPVPGIDLIAYSFELSREDA
jgi:ribosomal protein S18 acetylase RimI-like enzyme